MPTDDPIPGVGGQSNSLSVLGHIAGSLTGSGFPVHLVGGKGTIVDGSQLGNAHIYSVSGHGKISPGGSLGSVQEAVVSGGGSLVSAGLLYVAQAVQGSGTLISSSTLAELVPAQNAGGSGSISSAGYLEIPNDRFLPSQAVPTRDLGGKGGGSRYVSETLVWAICPRCSFRYRLHEMREEIYDQRPTGRRVCPECWDQDDPHLQISRIDLTDAGLLENPLPHPQRQSVCYSTDPRHAVWDHPLVAMFGSFTITAEYGAVTVKGVSNG